MNELALFAGAGGGILGGHLLGWRCVCAVEYDRYARSVLMARQNDGCLPPFPVWDDVRTFDGRPWRGRVDVVSGGFPCQDISVAGKGAGITGERSGLWGEMARIIGEVRPRFVWVENSPMLVSRGLAVVLGDLAALGFDARWGIVGAHHAGAPHKRDRIWMLGWDADRIYDGAERGVSAGNPDSGGVGGEVAHASSKQPDGGDDSGVTQGGATTASAWPMESGYASSSGTRNRRQNVAHADGGRFQQCHKDKRPVPVLDPGGGNVPDTVRLGSQAGISESGERETWDAGIAIDGGTGRTGPGGWWRAEPDVGRVAHGVASRVDRLRCIGNGQVPGVVQLAWGEMGGCR